MAAGAEVTVAVVDVVDGNGKSFTAVVSVGTDFTVVVTAGVTLTVSDTMLVADAIVVAGTLTATAEDDTVDGVVAAAVATVVVLAESSPVVFAVVETGGFVSTGAVCVGVGFTAERVDVTVLAGGGGVGVVGAAVTGIVADMESVIEGAEETWVDLLSGL